MSLEENKAVIRGLFRAFNEHNLDLIERFVAPDFVDHTLQLRGLDSFRSFEAAFIKAFPDYSETIEDMIAEGDRVWVDFKVAGTHLGEWSLLGTVFPPTGEKITYTGVGMWRMANGKAVERKTVRDMLDFSVRLGILEPTEKAKGLLPN
jgi:C-1 hydroxylase